MERAVLSAASTAGGARELVEVVAAIDGDARVAIPGGESGACGALLAALRAEPPADGKETCDRGPNEWNSYDCWGKCIAEDLVTAEGRQMIIDVVTSAARIVTLARVVTTLPAALCASNTAAISRSKVTLYSAEDNLLRSMDDLDYAPSSDAADLATQVTRPVPVRWLSFVIS